MQSAPNFAPRSAAAALEDAYAGEPCEVVSEDGTIHALPIRRWQDDADAADHELFVRPCRGDVLDVGCGPGRLTYAVAAAGARTTGIDLSREAVRQARARGANALLHNVFDHLPGRWDSVLLADGNIGIGGDPGRVLRRCSALVRDGGRVLAEVASHGGVERHLLRLRAGGELSEAYAWATVGVGAIGTLATSAGLYVESVASVAGRTVAMLAREA
ncbi:class I SAM-dependent methyltransferase [Solicola gregarius]|uniref:Methyltransferase domain-containing protein n=1 Tax=Solicola gregarius TaxID=2908642 RepID=A0AA46TG05_9ACTN|nr:methyltransferase domain-containing protein [Solicola gregarius]UYM04555.1 methyltransferase domain-containing protein [Solicola gregarius]